MSYSLALTLRGTRNHRDVGPSELFAFESLDSWLSVPMS